MNTQKEVKPRPDRALTNTNHVVVEAHGATPDHVEESDFDGHLTGEFEGKGENDERVAKASKATGGRHVTSKNGFDGAEEPRAHVRAKRGESGYLVDFSEKNGVLVQKEER